MAITVPTNTTAMRSITIGSTTSFGRVRRTRAQALVPTALPRDPAGFAQAVEARGQGGEGEARADGDVVERRRRPPQRFEHPLVALVGRRSAVQRVRGGDGSEAERDEDVLGRADRRSALRQPVVGACGGGSS